MHTRGERRERDYKRLLRAQVALPAQLAHHSRRSQEKNECPGAHCNLTVKKEKKTVPARSASEFGIKGKAEESTEWRGQSKSLRREENGRLVGTADTSEEFAEWCRLQRKNLNKLSLPKRKE